MSIETQLINEERKRINFDVEELTNLFDGGLNETTIRRYYENLVKSDPLMKQKYVANLPREERFLAAMKRTLHFCHTYLKGRGLNPSDPHFNHIQSALGMEKSFFIHTIAFVGGLLKFGSEEQVRKWVPLASNFNIVGAYAQTELGHGTFLRGLETTATYDPETQQFVLNCPQITSMKWWPGNLGVSANFVLLMAELILGGKKMGMHPFMVQIRDLSNHKPLEGVTVGDIGNKLGNGNTDNGFLILKNFKIPRENLLCKNGEVLSNGRYVKKVSDKMMYGSMVGLRVYFVNEYFLGLAQAVTIAVRYSVVRRQGSLQSDIPNSPEIAVMEYMTQQHKLLPLVATTYVLRFSSRQLKLMYENSMKEFDMGNMTSLPQLHALSAGMKASVTEQLSDGIEIARKACGGHGYSHASGIPDLWLFGVGACTAEGENTVMYLQCARFLLKCMMSEESENSLGFLDLPEQAKCDANTIQDLMDHKCLTLCFQHRSRAVLRVLGSSMKKMVFSGTPKHQAWNLSTIRMVEASKFYIDYYIVSSYFIHLHGLKCSDVARKLLTQIGLLYSLHLINQNTGGFIKSGYLSAKQCELCQDAEVELLTNLRGNCVGLVDAFDFSDESLNSCLGAFDGDVYNRLYDWAKSAPFNKTEVHQESYKLLRPYLLAGRDALEGKSKM